MTPWDLRQLHEDPDAALTRVAVLDDLERGVTSVWLQVGDGALAPADVPEALQAVRLDLAPVVVSSITDQEAAAAALIETFAAREVDAAAVCGSLGHDPVGAAALTGRPADLSALPDALARVVATYPHVLAMSIDARVWHDAGASDADEVGLAVSTGIGYVRHLVEQGAEAADAVCRMEFRVAATADQFATTAKLRALRRLWARVGEVLDVPETVRGARTHAVTSWRMQTATDPWVNVLRGTLACFGAAAGGADAITVLPYDTALGLPEPFSRRLARNTQSLLAQESNIARVADPAGGSWFVESLTEQIAQAAWARVQDVERRGGITAALADGSIAQRLTETAAERSRRIATRAEPLTGTSTFPLLDERPITRRPRAPRPSGGLPAVRDSAVFEALRARSNAHAAATGQAPQVTVAALGSRRQYGARQMFVTNLLAVAGVHTDLLEGDAARQAAPDGTDGDVVLVGVDTPLPRDGDDVVAWLTDLLDTIGVAA